MAPERWTKTTVGELCDDGLASTQTGPFGSQLHSYDYVPSGVPVIPTEAIGRRKLNCDGVPQVNQETAERLSRHRLRAGDILFARRGVQATGLSALVEPQHAGSLCGTGAILLRIEAKAVDSRFISFCLSADESIQWLKQHAVGAVMPNLNESIIRGLPLLLPPLPEQKRIAHILSTLDDNIELNRRMNTTLEGISRALFKSWFVDFDPVRQKAAGKQPFGMDAKTASLFPNSFEDSEIGEVPKGWSIARLGDVAEHLRRASRPGEIANGTPYIGLEHMPRRCIALADWGEGDGVESNKFEFQRGEILFGKLRPYFHKVGVAPVDGVCSTDIVVARPTSPEWLGIVLGVMSSDEFVAYTNAGSTGTKMPRTNWADMSRYEVVLPPANVAETFTKVVQAAVESITARIHQSRTLASLRDTLLPKLLSGEVRVPEAEEAVEEVLG